MQYNFKCINIPSDSTNNNKNVSTLNYQLCSFSSPPGYTDKILHSCDHCIRIILNSAFFAHCFILPFPYFYIVLVFVILNTNQIFPCTDALSLPKQALAVGHLGCFQFLSGIYTTVVNIFIQIVFLFLLNYILGLSSKKLSFWVRVYDNFLWLLYLLPDFFSGQFHQVAGQ